MGERPPLNARPHASSDVPAPILTPERWRQVKELFSLAQEQEPTRREAFLEQACGTDQALRLEIESLLASAESSLSATSEVFRAVSPPSTQEDQVDGEDPILGRRIGAYRVERRIGFGGMAAVYLASRADEQFQMQVALKLLRPDLDHAELLRRFLNERQTLAALDHPNIVKLLDGGSTEEGLPYLVMDYVEGSPIDGYCDDNRLSIEQRLQLFRKICDAVDYAHRHRVIHRDLKPNNILVTTDGIPKLLDFGISKVVTPTNASEVTRTATRHLTPAYASPEQVRADAVTETTDVYSLGVILYELLTGHRPYRLKQRTPAAMERAICEQEPESPSTAVDRVETQTAPDGSTVTITGETVSRTRGGQPDKLRKTLHGDLDNIVLKALQKEPQRRYKSAAEFSDDVRRYLEHHPVHARPSTLAYRFSKFVRRRKTEVIAGGTVVLVLAAAAGFSVWEEHQAANKFEQNLTGVRTGGPRSVAVLGFKNLSTQTETAWLSTALSEMLTTELAAGGKLRMIPGEDVAQTRINLSLAETDSFNRATLRRIYNNLGSDFVVIGSYLETGEGSGNLRLDLRLQDALRGNTIAAAAVSGNRSDLSELVGRAGAKLRESLAVPAISVQESSSVKASMPTNEEAFRLYSQGLEKQRVYDFLGARDLFEKSIVADPQFALAHLALSDIASSSGDTKRAQEEAKKALDLSGNLSREQNLMIQARYYEALHQWDKAIELRRTLFNFFPDNLDHGLQLVNTLSTAGKGSESLEAIAALRKLPAPERNDPRIDLAESLAANVVSDYKRQASAAEQAIQKAQAVGARVLVAQARIAQARAHMELGQKDKVAPELSEAQEIFKSVGDRFHAARVLQQVGLAYYYQGKLDDAKRTYLEALAIQRELGNRSNQGKLLNGIAMVLQNQDDLDGAQSYYQQALDLCREVDDRAMTGTVLSNLGGVEFNLGNYASAKKHLEEALAIARQVNEQSGVALELENIALILVAQGDLRAAAKNYEEAIQTSRRTGKNRDLLTILINRGDLFILMGELAAASKSYTEALQLGKTSGDQMAIGIATRSLGLVQFHHGDLEGARKSYQQAEAIQESIGDTQFLLDVRMAMAELYLENGRPVDAENESRQVAEQLRKAKDPDSEAGATILMASALLAQHKTDESRRVAAQAQETAARGSRATQFQVSCVQSEIEAAKGNPGAAANKLAQLVAETHKAGFVGEEFEARLALGKAQIQAGNVASGRRQLASLEHDAKQKGFLLVARKAGEGPTHH